MKYIRTTSSRSKSNVLPVLHSFKDIPTKHIRCYKTNIILMYKWDLYVAHITIDLTHCLDYNRYKKIYRLLYRI